MEKLADSCLPFLGRIIRQQCVQGTTDAAEAEEGPAPKVSASNNANNYNGSCNTAPITAAVGSFRAHPKQPGHGERREGAERKEGKEIAQRRGEVNQPPSPKAAEGGRR